MNKYIKTFKIKKVNILKFERLLNLHIYETYFFLKMLTSIGHS